LWENFIIQVPYFASGRIEPFAVCMDCVAKAETQEEMLQLVYEIDFSSLL